jgi:hypothetical protein
MSAPNLITVLTLEGSPRNPSLKPLYAKYKEMIHWSMKTFSEEAVYPTYGGFLGLGAPIVGETHPLWTGTSESARERCMAALGVEKVESGGRTVYKRGGNSSDKRRVKGLLTHVLSVLSDCGFSPSSVKNKSLDEICGMYAYITVYKGL